MAEDARSSSRKMDPSDRRLPKVVRTSTGTYDVCCVMGRSRADNLKWRKFRE